NLVRFLETPIRYINRHLHNYLNTTAFVAVEGTKIWIHHQSFKFAAASGNGRSISAVLLSPNPISHVRRSVAAQRRARNPQSPRVFPQERQTTTLPFRFAKRFL